MNSPQVGFFKYFGADFNTSSPIANTIEYPKWPNFIGNDQAMWDKFASCIKTEMNNEFPTGRCQHFSCWLFLFLALNYEGRLQSSDHLSIQIGGRKAKVSPRETWHGIDNHYTSHYFLKLEFAPGEIWILDPSWKQFARKFEFSTRKFLIDDPFNQMILVSYPDILIAKPDEFSTFFHALGNSIHSLDPDSSSIISNNKNYWNQSGKNTTSEFVDLVTLASQEMIETDRRYATSAFARHWPMLVSGAKQTAWSLQELCKNLLDKNDQARN